MVTIVKIKKAWDAARVDLGEKFTPLWMLWDVPSSLFSRQRNETISPKRVTLTEPLTPRTAVIAHKGYDSQAFIDAIQEKVCIPVIPPKRNCIVN